MSDETTTGAAGQSEATKQSFEQALAELETVVDELEEGEIGLAQGLARYEQGVKLLRQCYQLLSQAQNRIELLSRVDADGRMIGEPFDPSAGTLEEKAASRARRRSRSPQTKPAVDEPTDDPMDGPGRLF